MTSENRQMLIYGANGYTGELIAKEAVERGFKPVLAGRNKQAISQLAESLNLPARVFGLDSVEQVSRQLKDIHLVIHCAGPFSATAESMMKACISSNTHYTDITGEISVFERAQALNAEAKSANIVLCPGVGFDVIPTDCIASQLKGKMPDATYLALGFDSAGSMSPGTSKTMVEGLGGGGKIRRDGKIIQVPLAYKTRRIDFGRGEKNAITIPWGDVSTAFHSTGIPNIEVYIPISPRRAKGIRRLNWIRWLLVIKVVQNYLKNKAGKSARGPGEEQRKTQRTYLWGEAKNAEGKTVTARLETCNGYTLTYLGAVEVAKFLMENKVTGGAYTPSKLIDNKLVQRLPETSEMVFN